ncbi:unnamed protein product [Discula destructiva]
MLCGRRLLLSQAPLLSSGWRTSASTTTVPARCAHSRKKAPPVDLDSIHSPIAQELAEELAEESEGHPEAQKPPGKSKAEQNQQVRRIAKSETGTPNSEPGRSPHPRKYKAKRLEPGTAFRKYVSADSEPLNDQSPDKYLQEAHVSGTSQLDSPPTPAWLSTESVWTRHWIIEAAKRLGIRPTPDLDQFKTKVAARLRLEVGDERLATPSAAFAAIFAYEKTAKEARDRGLQTPSAFFRQSQRADHGTPIDAAILPPSKSGTARTRQSALSAEAKPALELRRRQVPKDVRPGAGDFVSSPLRDSLKDPNEAEVGAVGPSTRSTASEAPIVKRRPGPNSAGAVPWTGPLGLHRHNPALAKDSAGSMVKGEKAPNDIRFTVLPSWLPPNSPMKRWGQYVTNAEPATAPSGGLSESPIPKIGKGGVEQPENVTNTQNKPLQPLGSLASYSPLKSKAARPTETSEPTETLQNIFGMLFSSESEPGTESLSSSQPECDTDQKAKPVRKHRGMLEKPRGGIFKQLFPDEPPEVAGAQPREAPPNSTEESTEDPIFISLRNAIRNWIPEDERQQITAPEPGEYGSHSTVVMLSGLSNSLVETDFYRILPEGKHIEGWAGGLVKVVQARDQLSHEPIGRYFLMFHSRPAADAYKAQVLRLHGLSKRLLHSTQGTGPLNSAPADPQPSLTKAEQDAVRAFTLCPPTAPLRVKVQMWNTNLVREMAKTTNLADVVLALRPDMSTPAKVLVAVNTIPGSKAGAGGGLTADELWLTLRDDGRERGTPWVLLNLREGIMPVKLTANSKHSKIDIYSEAMYAPLSGPVYDEADMLAELPPSPTSPMMAEPFVARKVTHDRVWDSQARNEGRLGTTALAPEVDRTPRKVVARDAKFNRFIVTFAQPSMSRRFVRSWHKRAVWDAHEQRIVSIDAVALMSGN